MASVYIFFSNHLNRFYIGSCKDLSYRIDEHINKTFTHSYTAKADDWVLFFHADDFEYEQARAIEKHIKNMKSFTYILNLRKYPEILELLKSKYSQDGGPDSYRDGRRASLKH